MRRRAIGSLFLLIPHPSSFILSHLLGQPPVHHLHLAKGAHHHVVRLEVAVDDALGVGEADRLGDLLEIRTNRGSSESGDGRC